MFDVGITEIMVIAVVALVVIGPERLPRVARTIGTLLGRAQRYVNDVKAEVNREMELEELRKLQTQMQDAARDIQQTVSTAGADVQSAVQDVEKSLNESIAPLKESVASASAEISSVPLTEVTPLTEPPGTPVEGSGGTDPLPAITTPPAVAPAPAVAPTAAVAPAPAATPGVEAASAEAVPAQTSLFPEHTVR